MPLTLHINGQPRTFEDLTSPATLAHVLETLALKPDRIAVEHNGEIAPRASWPSVPLHDNDRLEVVHFVGGGVL
jgi:sulfur carrier protein